MLAVHHPLLPAPWRVCRRTQETEDVFTLWVEPEYGELPTFQPGQYNMLYLHGVGEVPISISSTYRPHASIAHTIRAVGPVTRALTELKTNDVVGLRGPYGTGWPLEEAKGRDVVLVAGGIGLAPLRSAIEFLMQHQNEYGRVTVLYGARTPAEILYSGEHDVWAREHSMTVLATVDHADGKWRGHAGVVSALIPLIPIRPEGTTALLCGPEVMMRFTVQALERAGMDHRHVFLSMERNMACAVGSCGHCQLGPWFVCKDGPVFRLDRVAPWFWVKGI